MAKKAPYSNEADYVVVGSGSAGYTAAIYAARADLQPLLFGGVALGGQLMITSDVENFPGFPEPVPGPELMDRMAKQVARLGVQVVQEGVSKVDFAKRPFRLETTEGRAVFAESVVVATGAEAQWLGLPSEKRLRGKGVSACATCDGFFFKGKEVVVVGGGATGIEFAGALAELIRGPLAKDFPTLDGSEVRVELLEAQGSLLPGLPERLRAYALSRLRRIGVFVRLNAKVSEVTSREVRLEEGLAIPTETTIWTTGVRGESIVRSAGLPIARGERLAVLPTLQVAGHPAVYAVGDIAYMEEIGRPLPMMAPVAVQQGTAAARNILRCIGGGEPLPFRYRDPGVMVILGRNAAVAHIGGYSFTGFPAWALWLIVHIYKLIGSRNRLVVLINWAWDYFFFERAQRLILP